MNLDVHTSFILQQQKSYGGLHEDISNPLSPGMLLSCAVTGDDAYTSRSHLLRETGLC